MNSQYNSKKFLIIIITCLFFIVSYGQDNTPYYLSKTFNKYIDYLIFKGEIDFVHPLNQPYSAKQLRSELIITNNDDYWKSILIKDLDQYLPNSLDNGKLILGIDGSTFFNYTDSSYIDNYRANIFGSYNYRNFLFYFSYNANSNFIQDSLYFDSVGKFESKIFGRISNSYIKYNEKYFNIFYGRLSRNYGLNNTNSLIRSENPFSYDHFSFEMFNKVLKYSFSTTRLDDIFGYDVRQDTIPNYKWYKRFITFHRLEISLSKKLKIGVTESILFGGKNQTWIPMYINPANIFFLNKMSDRKGIEENDANAFMAFEFQYKPIKRFAIYTQFLIDDMDFTKNLRAIYPDRLGLYSKIVITDLIPKSIIYLDYSKISNWTYNSFYTFGNYTYYGKSMGFPKNGFEDISIGIDYFKIPKFILSLKAQYHQERLQDLDSPFIASKTKFPIGVSLNSLGIIFEVDYIPNINVSFNLRLEYLQNNNHQHILGNEQSLLNFYLGITVKDIYNIITK